MVTHSIESWYSKMYLIRRVEETFLELFAKGMLNGTVHTCIGQEVCAVGVIEAIDKERDVVFSNHRAHGHFIAYCDDIRLLMAEVMGKKSGVCGGLGGSQHLSIRNFYTNGIQGGIVPCALGAAFAEKALGTSAIVVVFLGDGTMGQGVVYEGLNIASLWGLPILFVLEDNLYAQSTPKILAHAGSLTERAKPFGIESEAIRAIDVRRVHQLAYRVIAYVRENRKPFFLHLETYRYAAHSKGDDFRLKEEIENYKKQDPLHYIEKLLSESTVIQIREQTNFRIENALQDLMIEGEMDLQSFLALGN